MKTKGIMVPMCSPPLKEHKDKEHATGESGQDRSMEAQ